MKSSLLVLFIASSPWLSACEPKGNGDGQPAPELKLAPIVGGQDASPGEWPWQLSLERLRDGEWSHSCGATLLSATRALTSAYCVDGATASSLRVVAGLQQRSDQSAAQIAGVASYAMHQQYQQDAATYSNDLAVLNLDRQISAGGAIAYATLPANNNNDFAGTTCTATGWGQTSASPSLPDTLQAGPITAISGTACGSYVNGVSGMMVWDNQLCALDAASNVGPSAGEAGGPLNCPNGAGGYIVAGVASWGVAQSGGYQQSYPAIYTRTSAYLAWINSN